MPYFSSFFLFIELIISSIFLSSSLAAETKISDTQKPVYVVTEKISPHEFYQELKFAGNIKAFREVQVFSYIDGTIVEKLVANGQKVKAGQSIAAIKNIQPGFNYANHVVKAPISGVITDFFEEVGTLVSKNHPIVVIADTRQLRITIPVLQENLAILQGDDIRIEVQPLGFEQPLVGQLINISPNTDEVLGTTLVEFSVDPKDKALRPGMLAKAVIKYNLKNSLGLAEKYLSKDYYTNKHYIYAVNSEMKVLRKDIEVGTERDGIIEILSGLNSGDTVVTQSAEKLKDGLLITTEKPPSPLTEKRTL